MLRSVLAAAAGYVTMAVTVFVSLAAAYSILGPEFVFQGTSRVATTQWALLSSLLAFLAALGGGFVAGRVGKTSQSFLILVGIILVSGVAFAVSGMMSRADLIVDMNSSEWSFVQASRKEIHSPWFYFILPLVGALGVLWGGRRGYPESDV